MNSQVSALSDIRGAADDADLARLARAIHRQRAARARFIPVDLLGEPGWDLLLDLFASRVEERPVMVTSAIIASGVPATTALRWIGNLENEHLVERSADPTDARRQLLGLTRKGLRRMRRTLAAMQAQPSTSAGLLIAANAYPEEYLVIKDKAGGE